MTAEPGGNAEPEPEPKPKAPRKNVGAKKSGGPAGKLFPTITFEEALELGLAMQEHAAGQKVRLLTLFDKMKKTPTTGASRHLMASAFKYGITTSSWSADSLELTPDGFTATNPEAKLREQAAAKFRLAIESCAPFKGLYERLKGNKVPSREVLADYAGDLGVPQEDRLQCVDVFLANAKYIGVLKLLSGAERMVPLDHMLDDLPAGTSALVAPKPRAAAVTALPAAEAAAEVDFAKVCFFISPIGDEGSEHRKHADMMLSALVEKSLETMDLQVVRADKISKPGMISAQVIEYILRSKVVIADLSYHNPNVFYELSLRHATGLPTVHIIRSKDPIPFDLGNFRTITIDTADMYNLVALLDTYRSEIAQHVRQAIDAGRSENNPILTYHPNLKVQID